MMEPCPIATEHLCVGHGGVAVLRDVHLELPPGSLTALIGINGIGKSTLLRTVAGLLPPVEGTVLACGQVLHAMPVAERARHIAVVLTGRPDTGMLDVVSLVSLGRHPWTGHWGKLTKKDREAVNEAMEVTGIARLRHKLVMECSDGECQKVLIARALAQATPVLVLDEPTAYLDLPNRAAVVRMLRNAAHSGGRSVLFSTHDLQLALDLCDRLVLLRSAVATWQGTPAEAVASGELERAFQGSGVQFFPGQGTHRFTP